jgi:hypothetical protein
MDQYKPPPTAHLPLITTAGEFISRLHPLLQALVPAPNALGPEFSNNAKLAATTGHLRARRTGPPTTISHTIQITWTITHNTDNNIPLIQHHTTQPCLPEESKRKRGIQLGLLAIHIITSALDAIGIHINTIQLDSTSHQILEWTSYAAPRQGYNCLAKHNTDVGKELQNWSRKCKTRFTASDQPHPHDDDSESEDDTPHCINGTATHPTPRATVLFPQGPNTNSRSTPSPTTTSLNNYSMNATTYHCSKKFSTTTSLSTHATSTT